MKKLMIMYETNRRSFYTHIYYFHSTKSSVEGNIRVAARNDFVDITFSNTLCLSYG
jgi:hypothetical protein